MRQRNRRAEQCAADDLTRLAELVGHLEDRRLRDQAVHAGIDQHCAGNQVGNVVGMVAGPRDDRHAAQRVAGDDGPLSLRQRRAQDRVEVAGVGVDRVVVRLGPAAAGVAAQVVADHADVIAGKRADHRRPDLQRARPAVDEHDDRRSVRRAVLHDVQRRAVGRGHRQWTALERLVEQFVNGVVADRVMIGGQTSEPGAEGDGGERKLACVRASHGVSSAPIALI